MMAGENIMTIGVIALEGAVTVTDTDAAKFHFLHRSAVVTHEAFTLPGNRVRGWPTWTCPSLPKTIFTEERDIH